MKLIKTPEALVEYAAKYGVTLEHDDTHVYGTTFEGVDDRSGLYFNLDEDSQLRVAGSKDFNQILVKITDVDRLEAASFDLAIQRWRRIDPDIECKITPTSLPKTVKETVLSHLERQLPYVTVDRISKYEIKVKNAKDVRAAYREDRRVTAEVSYSRHVSGSVSETLLMGIDENAHFICGIPDTHGKVNSVLQAHKALRPPGVTAKTPRQGEFFFVPATTREVKAINDHIARHWGGESAQPLYNRDGDDTDHLTLSWVSLPEDNFVIGLIHNNRLKGQHAPLVLPSWHKIVPNLEISSDNGFD